MRTYSIQALLAAILAAFMSIAADAAMAGSQITLVPHRAVYDLTLKSRESRASIVSVRGRMVHEFNGSDCDGYSVSMRWVAQMADTRGEVDIDDIRFASFEGGDSSSYDFTSVRLLNDKVIEEALA